MRLPRTFPVVAAACGLTLFAAGWASAQEAPAAPGGPVQHGGMMRDRMEHMRAEHLRLLHDALGVRPDQEGAWRAFVAAMTPPSGGPERRRGPAADEGEHRDLTTPERLDRMEARMAEHMAAFQRHAAAVKALYAALSPAQQRTFDALFRLMHRMHDGSGHGEMDMHSGMDGPGGE